MFTSFEKTQIRALQVAVPDLAPELAALEGKLLVADKIPRHERDRVRKDLLAYCERDTWAMVRLLERLQQLATPGKV